MQLARKTGFSLSLFFFPVNVRVLIINFFFFFTQSLFTYYERSITVISKMKDHP